MGIFDSQTIVISIDWTPGIKGFLIEVYIRSVPFPLVFMEEIQLSLTYFILLGAFQWECEV